MTPLPKKFVLTTNAPEAATTNEEILNTGIDMNNYSANYSSAIKDYFIVKDMKIVGYQPNFPPRPNTAPIIRVDELKNYGGLDLSKFPDSFVITDISKEQAATLYKLLPNERPVGKELPLDMWSQYCGDRCYWTIEAGERRTYGSNKSLFTASTCRINADIFCSLLDIKVEPPKPEGFSEEMGCSG